MSSLVLCKGHLRKFGSDEGGKVCCGFLCCVLVFILCVFFCPCAASRSFLLRFLGSLLRFPSFPRYRRPMHRESPALGAGAETGDR